MDHLFVSVVLYTSDTIVNALGEGGEDDIAEEGDASEGEYITEQKTKRN